MAIYTGNWEDGAGDPFCPEALGRPYKGAQVAQAVRRGRDVPANITEFIKNIQALAIWWNTALTGQNRLAWRAIGQGPGSRQRKGLFQYAVWGWNSYSSVNFAAQHSGSGFGDSVPRWSGWDPFTFRIHGLTVGNQLIEANWFQDIGNPWNQGGAFMLLYQVDPAYIDAPTCMLHTRMIGGTNDAAQMGGPPGHYPVTGTAAWPFKSDDRVKVFSRYSNGALYHAQDTQWRTAPVP